VIKCLRVLLNTEPGFTTLLSSPVLVTHIAFTLHGASSKLRTLSSEVLAAICVLSLTDGHRLVLASLSDYRVAHEENFRFEELIDVLRIADDLSGEQEDFEGLWEVRTATMALINALTNCPESLEERVFLREEFTRRGLNEVVVVRIPEIHHGCV
jgi:diaphanous 1